jgi:phage terminase Nu1 subunit (DNA packaging protein)
MATATEAAEHVFISPSRFRDLVGLGTITRMPAGKYDLNKVREEYCRNAQRIMQGRAADGGAALSAKRARLADAQAQAAEFRNAQLQGGFVQLGVVRRLLEQLFGSMREVALGVPGKISESLTAYCSEDRETIHEVIKGEIYEMLNTLADPNGVVTEVVAQSASKK